jgi:hypothetical protein
MGYAANGFCFDTPDAAASYACGHDFPVVTSMVDGTGHPATVVTECTGSTGNVLALQRSVNGMVDGTSSLALTSPGCDVTEWQQFYPFSMSVTTGAEVGAAVVGAWLVGWGWKAMYMVLRGRAVAGADSEE